MSKSARQHVCQQLLGDARIEGYQSALSSAYVAALASQGVTPISDALARLLDTGVGAMRELRTDLFEPVSGAALQLVVVALAKVDGSFQCWTELWSRPQESASVARVSKAHSPATTPPSRLRLMRHNLFQGQVAQDSLGRDAVVDRALEALQAQGLGRAVAVPESLRAQLGDVLSV